MRDVWWATEKRLLQSEFVGSVGQGMTLVGALSFLIGWAGAEWQLVSQAPLAFKIFFLIGVALLALCVVGALLRRRPARLAEDLLAASGNLTSFLRGRAIRAAAPGREVEGDWPRREHGDEAHQRETTALFHEEYRERIVAVANRAWDAKVISNEQRRLLLRAASVDELWRVVDTLSWAHQQLKPRRHEL